MRTVFVIGLDAWEEDSGGYSFFVNEKTVVSVRLGVVGLRSWKGVRLL